MNSPFSSMTIALLSALLLSACGASGPRFSSIDEIRRRAAGAESDPARLTELGSGELLASGGDASAALEPLERAISLDPQQYEARFLSGLIHQVEGRHSRAAEMWMALLEECANAPTACRELSEATATLWSELHDAPGYRDLLSERLVPLLERSGSSFGMSTRMILQRAVISDALRRGDPERVRTLETSAGCIPSMRVAGPFGPLDLIGFDEPVAADDDERLGDSYDFGPTRGVGIVREVDANACRMHLGNPALQEGGTYIAESFFEASQAGLYDISIDSPNTLRLSVGDTYELLVDRRQNRMARRLIRRVHLPAGTHRVRVRLSSRHSNPVLAIAFQPSTGPNEEALPRARNHVSRLLRTLGAQGRVAPVEARETLREAVLAEDASAVLLLQAALAANQDPTLPPSVRRDESRRLLTLASERNPDAWYPHTRLARLRAAEGQAMQAITDLRPLLSRWPESPEVSLVLIDLLLRREMKAEAHSLVPGLVSQNPESCLALGIALRVAQSIGVMSEIAAYSTQLSACDARNSSLYQWHSSRRNWDAALAEVERLESLAADSDAYRFIPSLLQLAEGRGDRDAIASLLRTASEVQPRSAHFATDRIDALLGGDHAEEAAAFMQQALLDEPFAQHELRRLVPVLNGSRNPEGQHPGSDASMEAWRVDGLAVIEAFERSGRQYDEPDVLVLDHSVFRVLADGSSIEVTHHIHRIQSEEAVNSHGEYSRPENSRILRLRTIKADGRVLEPDEIAGKDTISLPSLSPNDYVESEYIRYHEPYRTGGSLGWRFFFEANEQPFDLSRLTVIAPEEMELILEPRGGVPATQRSTEDGLQILSWTQEESRPRSPEPGSVSPQEFTASMQWGIGVSWAGYSRIIYDNLLDKDVVDPAARRLVHEILNEDPAPTTTRERAHRLYRWVLSNIERTNNVLGQASWMIASRSGDRSRLLHYLLGLAGIESRLVMVSMLGTDRNHSELPRPRQYEHLHVEIRVPGDPAPIYAITTDEDTPFGYIPGALLGQPGLYLTSSVEPLRMPDQSPIADESTWHARIDLHEDGSAEIRMQERHTGFMAISLRAGLRQIPAAELEARMGELYVSRVLPGAQLQSLRVGAQAEAEEPLEFDYTFRVDQIGRRSESLWALPPIAAQSLTQRAASLPERRTPALVFPLINSQVTVEVVAPAGYRFAADTVPASRFELASLGASFESTRMDDQQRLIVSRQMRLTQTIVEPSEYSEFAEFCRGADQLDQREIVLERIEP